MLEKLLCLLLLAVQSLPKEVAGQTIVWGPVNKTCSNLKVMIRGERIILNAVLNTSQSNSSYWPFSQIHLQQLNVSKVFTNICEINLTPDTCHGPRPDLCGYCDHQNDDQYFLAFNITVATYTAGHTSFRVKSSSPEVLSPVANYTIIDYPYARTEIDYTLTYRTQDATRNAFELKYNTTFAITLYSTGEISWRFGNQAKYTKRQSSPRHFRYDLSQWNSHIDDVIQAIMFDSQCPRNWSVTIPVTNTPELVCGHPVLYKNQPKTTEIVTQCRFSKFPLAGEELRDLSCDFKTYPIRGNALAGKVTRERDVYTCMFSVLSQNLRPNETIEINIKWNPIIDIQFTNGTGQTPRVVRFNVNGSRSITVEPGEDVSFECKVYGNPTAVAVLVGTGLGRIQEERSDTDLLLTTLAKVQCEDSGKYTCKGVSGFGSTPGDRQAHVDLNVRCPPTVKSHVPSDINRKFNFDPGSNILVTLEVYGYPVPTDFGLQLGQGSSSSEFDKDQYSVSSVELNPPLAVLTLIIFSRDNGGPETYVFRISNGANSSLDFQFEAGEFETDSAWMTAFVAVMCVFCLSIIAVIVICVIKTRCQKKDGAMILNTLGTTRKLDTKQGTELHTSSYVTTNVVSHSQSSTKPGPKPDAGNIKFYDVADQNEDCIYQNVQDNVYENPSSGVM